MIMKHFYLFRSAAGLISIALFLIATCAFGEEAKTDPKALVQEPVTAPAKQGIKTDPSENYWAPMLHIQTSPIGAIAKRYKIQVGHFFNENIELSGSYTKINGATQAIFGHEDGYEAGLRGSFFIVPRNSQTKLGAYLGVYKADFQRGNALGDAFSYIFQSPLFDRDEVKGAMFELMVGALTKFNFLTAEILGGIQTYEVNYYTYNTSTGARSTRLSPEQRLFPVVEFNFGIAF
jgi:hypothetical protein